ncbi:TIR domain-containing protein [Streptomyces sviceus]|uniref:TIR domain-containing protein n=1 Tax=Streptomyces sviceus TaxID=285530 RepID=UPI0036F05E41
MANYFVTSFAAAEHSLYAARFHDDLAREVARQRGRRVEARKCDPDVPAGERRSLVAETGVLVVLWSLDYFGDGDCADDWALFERRLSHVPAQRRASFLPTRVLVRWRTVDSPPPGLPRPPMIGGDVMADYNKDGLYKVVRHSPDSSAYQYALRQLAAQVHAGLATDLPSLEVDDLSLPNPVLPGPRPTGSTVSKPKVLHPTRQAMPAPGPRVLISYAHDETDPRHAKEVKSLSELLKREGINVRLDQDVDDEPQNWLRWMQNEMSEADYILSVASPAYKRRVEHREKPGTGRGATWEGGYILDVVYDNWDTWQKRILRVVFPRFNESDLPAFPGSASVTVYRIDPVTGDGHLDRLLRYMRRGPAGP